MAPAVEAAATDAEAAATDAKPSIALGIKKSGHWPQGQRTPAGAAGGPRECRRLSLAPFYRTTASVAAIPSIV
ncbi:hypothetical protein AGMMS49942_00890 [Spirochaetia bacterium]|nr:hypothetical protein AGMMS49942_00890 [Spirochaetia bacterium]